MTDVANILVYEAASILEHTSTGIPKSLIHAPGPDYIEGRISNFLYLADKS